MMQRLLLKPRNHHFIMDQVPQSTPVGILHDDIHFVTCFIIVRLFVLSDIWMVHLLQDLDLTIYPLEVLLVVYRLYVYLLDGRH